MKSVEVEVESCDCGCPYCEQDGFETDVECPYCECIDSLGELTDSYEEEGIEKVKCRECYKSFFVKKIF